MPPKKPGNKAGAKKAPPAKKPAAAKPAAAKPAAAKPAAAKPAAAKPAAKKPSQPIASAPEALVPAVELAAVQIRLASAERAAGRVGPLEEKIADLESQLAGANFERGAALQRLADLEQRLADSAAELEAALTRRVQEARKEPREDAGDLLVCPRCAAKMVEFVHLGVTLDRCTSCAGLFFDSGELQEVLRREYPEPQAEAAAAPESTPAPDEPGKPKGFFRSLFGRKPTA